MDDTAPSESEAPPDARAPVAQPAPRDPAEDRPVSPTGAARGHPAAEHGAYGMVREEADPALSEREIRGLGPAAQSGTGR